MRTPKIFSKERLEQTRTQPLHSLGNSLGKGSLRQIGRLTVAIASALVLIGTSAARVTAASAELISPIDMSQADGVFLLALDYDLNRAKNLARQRGEAENGGVSVYETEPSMHGPAAESPHVINADGSVTFTFRGGPRGDDFYTVETQVTVAYDAQNQWDIVTEYNREIPPTPVPMSDLM